MTSDRPYRAALARGGRRRAPPQRGHAVRRRWSRRCSRSWTNRRCRRSWIEGVRGLAWPVMPSRSVAVLVAALSLLALPAAAQAAKAKPQYYVSLGDSYAAGYQRFSATDARTTRDGFALPARRQGPQARLQAQARQLRLRGETSVSILKRKAKCGGLGPGGVDYAGQTQATAAEKFLRKHGPGQADHGLHRRQRRDRLRQGGRPRRLRRPRDGERQGQRQDAAQAPAQGSRQEDPDRRHPTPT